MNAREWYNDYVICLSSYVYGQDSDIWQRQPRNSSKAQRFTLRTNHFRSQGCGSVGHSEFPHPLNKTASHLFRIK